MDDAGPLLGRDAFDEAAVELLEQREVAVGAFVEWLLSQSCWRVDERGQRIANGTLKAPS